MEDICNNGEDSADDEVLYINKFKSLNDDLNEDSIFQTEAQEYVHVEHSVSVYEGSELKENGSDEDSEGSLHTEYNDDELD